MAITGTKLSNSSHILVSGSLVSKIGAFSKLLDGSNCTNSLTNSNASSSLSAVKCVTPDFVACVDAPPKSSNETSSFVTVLITSGPVINI